MDTHSVSLVGGPAEPSLVLLKDVVEQAGAGGLAWPARFLFWLRESLGAAFGWDDGEGAKQPHPDSFYWKMSEEERLQWGFAKPGTFEGPGRVLWNDSTSVVLEVLNATCQAFAVGWVSEGQAHLAVFVIETKWWSRYYLALIEPFRRSLVYPALTRWLFRVWRSHFED